MSWRTGPPVVRTLAGLLIVCATSLSAQGPPELITDRPDFTESAVVVPLNSVQLEAGMTYTDVGHGFSVLSGPEALIRWTAAPRFELRFGLPDHIDVSGGSDPSGLGDSSIGIKYQFGPFGDWDVAAIAELSLPTGDREFTSDEYDPTLILIGGTDLNQNWSFGTQIGASWATEDGDRELGWGATAVLGYALSDRWGTFFEVATDIPEEGSAATQFHTGLTFAADDEFQIDVHGGFGLSDAAPDWFIGAGFAARF